MTAPASSTSFWRNDMLYEIIDGVVRREIPQNNGIARYWHANGQLAKEGAMKNGLCEGIQREWHANGQLSREFACERGLVHGAVKQWSSEGKLLGEYTLSYGRGTVRKWNDDGSLSAELEIIDEGVHRGTVWDDKGKAREVFLWNGKPVSKTKFSEKLAKSGVNQSPEE